MNKEIINKENNQVALADAENLAFIKKQFFPVNATEKDIEFCLKVAQAYSLNPVLREIFFVERMANVNGAWVVKVEPLVSRDGLLSIAHKSGKLSGIKSESFLKETPVLINGEWEIKKDLCAVANVYRTDTKEVFSAEVFYSEYAQKTKEGKITKFWAEKPHTMLKKVAESQALRKAFNINGIYTPEELDGIKSVGVDVKTLSGVDLEVEADIDEPEIFYELDSTPAEADSEKKAVEALGLSVEEKNGYLKIMGNTYKKEAHIKALGYTLHKASSGENIWIKKLA